MHSIRLQRLDPVPVAVVRRLASRANLSRLVPEGCGIVWNVLRGQGLRGGRHVAIYWDGTIRLEVGVEMREPFVETGEVVRSLTPGGLVASVTHLGPYSGLGSAHDAVQRWCADRQHRLAGPCWEVYGHWDAEWDRDPSRIRTEVVYQLAEE